MITKNCANKQSIVLIRFFDLKINLFLEWSVCRLMTVIQTGLFMEGLIDGDKSIFIFLNPGREFFRSNIFFFQQH